VGWLEGREGIERLFFELASESRLSILRELQQGSKKLNAIARKLDLTQTEAFRQLQRLTETFLVEKHSDVTYGITDFGKLVLHHSLTLEFISKHREYFLAHDVWRLPIQFVDRIGELANASLQMDPIESINKVSRMIREAEQYIWGMGESAGMENLNPAINEQIARALHFRFLGPETIQPPTYNIPPALSRNFELKTISVFPVFVLVTEKEAAVGFRCIGGRLDYSGFAGDEDAFLNWAKDLFLFYWDKGKRA
jgi:predicted transcriptional regulator